MHRGKKRGEINNVLLTVAQTNPGRALLTERCYSWRRFSLKFRLQYILKTHKQQDELPVRGLDPIRTDIRVLKQGLHVNNHIWTWVIIKNNTTAVTVNEINLQQPRKSSQLFIWLFQGDKNASSFFNTAAARARVYKSIISNICLLKLFALIMLLFRSINGTFNRSTPTRTRVMIFTMEHFEFKSVFYRGGHPWQRCLCVSPLLLFALLSTGPRQVLGKFMDTRRGPNKAN